jgi:hypothetical protein
MVQTAIFKAITAQDAGIEGIHTFNDVSTISDKITALAAQNQNVKRKRA